MVVAAAAVFLPSTRADRVEAVLAAQKRSPRNPWESARTPSQSVPVVLPVVPVGLGERKEPPGVIVRSQSREEVRSRASVAVMEGTWVLPVVPVVPAAVPVGYIRMRLERLRTPIRVAQAARAVGRSPAAAAEALAVVDSLLPVLMAQPVTRALVGLVGLVQPMSMQMGPQAPSASGNGPEAAAEAVARTHRQLAVAQRHMVADGAAGTPAEVVATTGHPIAVVVAVAHNRTTNPAEPVAAGL